MLGEQVPTTHVDEWGLLGDRAYAVVDRAEGKVASAKNPRKWPRMFEFRAALPDPAEPGAPVTITLPDGTVLSSDHVDVDDVLSGVLGRSVTLQATEHARLAAADPADQKPSAAQAEEYWPDMEGLDYRDTVTDFDMPEGTFFDCAVVHLLTTATLARLRELHPQGRFEIPRFRPNVVVDPGDGTADFVENTWVGRTVRIGDDVRLAVTEPCPRCVMTTLRQGDLPKDSDILRTAARYNGVHVGVYASVLHGGEVARGDAVRLE
jgi:hypothetical protein